MPRANCARPTPDALTTVATIARIEARTYRAPIARPVTTSFGVMHDRPALFVGIEDSDGRIGWGEAWCNFPAVGAEHRARLIDSALAPLALGQCCDEPPRVFEHLSERTAVLAIQSGEPGPLAQAIAAIDTALCDLAAQRAGLPLWRWLGGVSPTVGVYASGINPDAPEAMALRLRDAGHRAFKIKLGFGTATDLANLARVREAIGVDALLAADVNQGWTLAEALARAQALTPFNLAWLEEPLRADVAWSDWQRLASACTMPLAGGENIAGVDTFDAAVAAGALGVIQPDLAKWGGLSGWMEVARAARAAGRRVCPHYLGGGIGLLASAHALAALGGDGLLEIDSNPNPLRELMCGAAGQVADGRVTLTEAPGLGVPPAGWAAIDAWRRPH